MLLLTYMNLLGMLDRVRSTLHERFTEVLGSETGATAAEYALLVSLIAIAIVIGATHLGSSINTRLDTTATCVGVAPGTAC